MAHDKRERGRNDPVEVAVVDIWTFRMEPTAGDIDLAGYTVEALDGKIGKVDEATYETDESYIVVDTGQWISGRKVMLPAGLVDRIDPGSETVFVNRGKDEIKGAPEHDESDQDSRERLGSYYRRGVMDDPHGHEGEHGVMDDPR